MNRTSNTQAGTKDGNEWIGEDHSTHLSSFKTKPEQKKAYFMRKNPDQYHEHTEHLLGTFVGDDERAYYLRKWERTRPTWNWAAFLLSLWWLGYRRMYIPLIAILGGLLFLRIVSAQFNLDFNKVDGLFRLAVMISLGIWGNSIYRHHAFKTINKYKSKYTDQKVLEERIAAKGGVSFESFMISNVIIIIYIVILVAL